MAIATPEQPPAAKPAEQGLPLPSLRIRGYRLFEDLTLPRLARVNLITGKNNTGKTALLEAIRIWADAGAPRTLRDVLERRGDDRGGYRLQVEDPPTWGELGIEGLFHGHPASLYEAIEILIEGFEDSARGLMISAGTYVPEYRVEEGISWFIPNRLSSENRSRNLPLAIAIQSGNSSQDLDWQLRSPVEFVAATSRERLPPDGLNCDPCVFVSSLGLGSRRKEQFWDAISLTDDEDEVAEVVRLFSRQVERINLRSIGEGRCRVPYARIAGIVQPIPLSRLGDGVNRALGIGLALINSQDGCLLLDEIENGIHYSLQPNLWRMIFATAKRLNVQVFATTHSYDCIRGFQQAAAENEEVEGQLIRLQEHEGQIIPAEFDERDLEVVTRRNLEVR